ncbi:MAG: M28 family peptidase, partial [Myxococcales bacterium]
MNRVFISSLVAIFALLGLAALRYRPPPPGALANGARAAYERVLGEQTPHPVGSAHDARIRERLIARLSELGYRPEVVEGSSCGSSRGCGRTRSIVARREGREPGPAVWLNSHYDSVWAGPAVSDDGAGVSAGLEIARVLSQEPPHRRAIALLFNEGEEPGLLGAEVLVRHKEFIEDVAAIVNLEARGTEGPSLMFETSPGNEGLIDLYAKAIPRPVTNSLSYAIYKQLPNDTDLTVFKRAGLTGYGFAFIGGTARYHTPLDDLAHGDLGTLQQQTENALALVRTLADADLVKTGDAFFFDVFALFVVRGSFLLIRILAVLAALALVIALRTLRPRFLAGGAVFLGCIALSAAVSAGVLALLHPPYPWLAQSTAIRALFVCLPLSLCALVRTVLWDTLTGTH